MINDEDMLLDHFNDKSQHDENDSYICLHSNQDLIEEFYTYSLLSYLYLKCKHYLILHKNL